MPSQLSALSKEEQDARYQQITRNSIRTVTFNVFQIGNATNFPTVLASNGAYRTYSWNVQNALSIIGVQTSLIMFQATGIASGPYRAAVQVSYNPKILLDDLAGVLVTPANEGDVIHTMFYQTSAQSLYAGYVPYGYFVQQQQPIYIHYWIDNTALTAADNTVMGSATLHTIQTDRK